MSKLKKRLFALSLLGFATLAASGCTIFGIGGGDDDVEDERVVVEAPIELATILVLESFPPQYMVHIVSGLPNGCAKYNATELVERASDTFRIRVTNTMPADPDVACDASYGRHESNLNLGSANIVPGRVYVVDVNGTTETFAAQ